METFITLVIIAIVVKLFLIWANTQKQNTSFIHKAQEDKAIQNNPKAFFEKQSKEMPVAIKVAGKLAQSIELAEYKNGPWGYGYYIGNTKIHD